MMNKWIFSLMLACIVADIDAQEFETINPDTMNIDPNESGYFCLLTNTELAKRKDELKESIFSKMERVEEVEDGYLFHFRDQENLLPNLFHYIIAEKECCPFFHQDVSIAPEHSGITWRISGDKGIKKMIRQTFDHIEFPE